MAESGLQRGIAIIGAIGTILSSIQNFLYRAPLTPFQRVYLHQDWDFAAIDHDYPRLYIPAHIHGMGKTPHVEFRQGDQFFPVKIDADGNVVIIRNNQSFGIFPPLGVIIREHA